MAPRALLIGNPTAQSGKAQARIERARAAMQRRGWTVEVQPTAPEGRTVSQVRRRLDEERWPIAIYLGGDGTFAEVAEAVLASEAPVVMGMLPSGTANDQGKSFGVSAAAEALEENLDVIAAGHPIALDVGRITQRDSGEEALFFDSVGFGFQADILRQRNADREKVERVPVLRELYRDFAVYAGATLNQYARSFAEPTKFDAEVVADGRPLAFQGLIDLVVKATAVYGGQWVLDRRGEPDDGRFELVPFEGRRDWVSKILRDLKDVPIWQEHLEVLGVEHSQGVSASTFDLELDRPGRPDLASQRDGEEWVFGRRFRVEVIEQKLPLLVPAGFVPPWKPLPESPPL